MIAFAVGVFVVGFAATVTAWICRLLPTVAGAVPWLGVVLTTVVTAITFFDLPYGSGTDELIYQNQAESVQLSLILTGGLDPEYAMLDPGKAGWPTILGSAYFLAGTDSPYLGIVINAVVAYLSILLALAAGARIYGERRWREWFGMVLVASPALLIYGATLLRECWAWMSVAVALHGLIWLIRRCWWTGSLTTVAAVLIAYWIRSPLGPILLAATITGVVISLVWRHVGTKGAVVAFVGMGLVGRLALGVVLGAVGYSVEALGIAREYLAEAATTGFAPADPFTPVGLVLSLVRVGIGPLLWEFRPAPAWAWVFLNWVYWLVIVVLTIKAVRRAGLNAANVAVLAFTVVLVAGLAVGLTNYGIVVRMRATVIIALLPVMWGILAPARVEAPKPLHEEAA